MKPRSILPAAIAVLTIAAFVVGCGRQGAGPRELQLQPIDAKVDLVNTSLLNGKLTLLIPRSFQPMSEEMLRIKYPSERRPTLVWTDERGTVNIAVKHTPDALRLDQLPEILKNMESSFKNLYPSATWFRSELATIGGKQVFVLDLRTPAIDTQVRNVMVGTVLEGRLLLVTFNTVQRLEDAWLPVGNRIIMSIRVAE